MRGVARVPLLDTHQHLIYPDRGGYAWTDDLPALAGRRFAVEDYQALTRGAGVAGTIFMEAAADDWRAEARMVAELAKAPGSGILGLIAGCDPTDADGFDAWLDESEALGAVGWRRILHVVPDDLSRDEAFRVNVRRIGARDRVFDMCFRQDQLGIALELARACDGTRLVMDHCGVPDIAGGEFDAWRDGVTALAGMPNVTAKISGVLAYCAPDEADLDAVRPYVDHVIAAFGPDRCLWGSDWPVVDTRADLPAWIAASRSVLDGLSEDEARAIAHGTAERVYRVALPG